MASPTIPVVPYDASVITPLRLEAWGKGLQSMPDQVFASSFSTASEGAFVLEYGQGVQFQPAKRNLRSAAEHPQVITDYLRRQVELGRMQRVLTELQLPPLQSDPKKKEQTAGS